MAGDVKGKSLPMEQSQPARTATIIQHKKPQGGYLQTEQQQGKPAAGRPASLHVQALGWPAVLACPWIHIKSTRRSTTARVHVGAGCRPTPAPCSSVTF